MFSRLRPQAVRDAARRIGGHVKRTPLVKSDALSRAAGGDVYLKLENLQTTGSFKLRGALNALSLLPSDAQRRGVVTSSAGNHGLGVAYAASALGIPATIFVPSTAPDVKKNGIRALGATLDDAQPDYDAAMAAARAFGAEHGLPFVNPCLGDDLLAGQGTVALEILQELPALRTLLVPVGGGGLLGGCASLVRHDAPNARIVGAQSDQTAAMARSVAAGRVVEIPVAPTLADGLAGQIDEHALDIGVHALDDIVLLTEDEIARAIAWLHAEHDLKVEGAGAVAAGAALLGKTPLAFPAVAVVSGGNIDDARWRGLIGPALYWHDPCPSP
ncbi:MAG: pyridoxal-phosphate dependent enzyme [Gemmatimonadota bacterium]|nr:pyridoxal-phosphate dependent enzyme [Gemmatimonadota bacterium]